MCRYSTPLPACPATSLLSEILREEQSPDRAEATLLSIRWLG
jgi:hypothetical protein